MEQKILESAERLFLEKGYALTSTTEIAKEAGCNQALVHYYFRTKENLFQKIFENKIRLFASAFTAADEAGGSFEDKLQRKIEAHFDILKQNPKLPFLLLNELSTNPGRIINVKERIKALPQSVLAALENELKTEIEKGRIRPVSAVDLFINLVSLNIFTFSGVPLFAYLIDADAKNFQDRDKWNAFIEHRKKEIVTTLLHSLKP